MLVNIFMLLLFWPFSYSLMQFPPSILKLSTQHPPYFFKLSTQHQPAITRIESWTILPTQGLHFSYTLIRTFSKISAYTKTVQFYSTKNTTMNKFLAQCSSPCLMLGGIPPASLSEGWLWPGRCTWQESWCCNEPCNLAMRLNHKWRLKSNGRHLAEDIFRYLLIKSIVLTEIAYDKSQLQFRWYLFIKYGPHLPATSCIIPLVPHFTWRTGYSQSTVTSLL